MTEDRIVKDAAASKSERLSKDDLQYLMGLLDKAEEEMETEGNGKNKTGTLSTRKRIIRIRLALIDFDKKGRDNQCKK
ncbi:MAG: hypothetical protein WBL68_05400 [Nitrososphaeraceae archaeon]|jgi:hypothetical protein